MGTWAAGNFDNDGAMDYVGELIEQLTKTITKCFDEDDEMLLDEGGEDYLMPSVAIIKMLSENCNAAPPKPQVIKKWQKRYLASYDKNIDGLDPNEEYKVTRRQVIDQTFNDLINLSQSFWKK